MFIKTRTSNAYLFETIDNTLTKYRRMEAIDALLKQEYFDQAFLQSWSQKMIDEATKAYVNGLGDPYTAYLDAEEFSWLQKELEWEGHIEGIGAVVGKKDSYLQVEEVIKGSPAFKAWIIPLDRILLIGTGETRDLSTSEAVQKIRGPKGSTIELFIERPSATGKSEFLEKIVTRDIIDIPSVKGTLVNYSGTTLWLLEISIFGDQTNKLMNRAISEFLEAKVKGIILDLRGNGGGLLESAVELAGHFLTPGTLVVQTKYHNHEDTNYFSQGFGELQHTPLVILLDELSASASEILALALKDHLWAPIVGMQSFGKGSIQTLEEFQDKSSLKYTIGKRYSPQGASIDQEGITPDIKVELNLTGYFEQQIDNQLEVAKAKILEEIEKKSY